MQQSLMIFGIAFATFCAAMVLIPYWRRRADLISTWNLFLVGSGVFVGGSALNLALFQKPYLNYAASDYYYYYAGVLAFYTTAFFVYYAWAWPGRIAGKWFRRWPSTSPGMLLLLIPFCVLFSLSGIFPVPIPVVGQIFGQMGGASTAIALTLAFVAWYQNRVNPILLYALLFTAMYALVFAVFGGTGRRQLVAVLAVVPICLYWLWIRYKSRSFTLTIALIAVVSAMFVVSGYTAIRHRHRGVSGFLQSPLQRAVESIQLLPGAMARSPTQLLLGQNAVNVSLASIHLYTGPLDPEPFHSTKYVLVNPVPREFWPDKPRNLGTTIVEAVDPRGVQGTWGPGIVGHGYHEGGRFGWAMLIFYGAVFSGFLRFFDELLARQPNNPFVLGILSASSGQIMGWVRGDIGTFGLQIINAFATGLVLAIVARAVFGAAVEYPRTDHVPLKGTVYTQ